MKIKYIKENFFDDTDDIQSTEEIITQDSLTAYLPTLRDHVCHALSVTATTTWPPIKDTYHPNGAVMLFPLINDIRWKQETEAEEPFLSNIQVKDRVKILSINYVDDFYKKLSQSKDFDVRIVSYNKTTNDIEISLIWKLPSSELVKSTADTKNTRIPESYIGQLISIVSITANTYGYNAFAVQTRLFIERVIRLLSCSLDKDNMEFHNLTVNFVIGHTILLTVNFDWYYHNDIKKKYWEFIEESTGVDEEKCADTNIVLTLSRQSKDKNLHNILPSMEYIAKYCSSSKNMHSNNPHLLSTYINQII